MHDTSTPFAFHSEGQWMEFLSQSTLDIPFTQNLLSLSTPLTIGHKTIANRILYQPMEGCDGTRDGKPDRLTQRRYARYAAGGAGIIWMEAVAVCEEGRANPRQLWLNPQTLSSFQTLINDIKSRSMAAHGFAPLVIVQLTHSGRYAKPQGEPAPWIAYNNPLFEAAPIDPTRILSDDRLKALEEEFAAAAHWAELAGADGVDIKCCHRYLLSEFLSAYERPGEYGGSFENRTRLLRNAVAAAKAATNDTLITTRLNLYDGFPYPYGFGVQKSGGIVPDYTEGMELCRILHETYGVSMVNVTIGNPYVNPHVNRPANTKANLEIEPPLKGVERILGAAKALKEALPSLIVACSGLSYLRQFLPSTAAAMIQAGRCDLAGLGRAAFAYPDIASAMLHAQPLDEAKCCIGCGKCSELMRAGTVAGCVIRDTETYLPYYHQFVLKKGE